jgi:predicted dehydrogenase
MPRSLRVAVVGCGKVADSHVNAILYMPDTRLVAVCDTEPLMAEQLSMRFGHVPIFDDLDELIEREHPDIVHITTPPQSHLTLARKAFDAGCHVFLEKPVAVHFHEVVSLLDAARASGRLLTVNYQYLFDHAALRLRKMCSEDFLGRIVHIESMYGYNLAGPYGSAVLQNRQHWVHNLPGKLLHNVIDHLINKIVDLAPGNYPERIYVRATSLSEQARAEASANLFDELRVFLEFANLTAYATFSSSIRPMGHFVRVYGTRRSAMLDLTASSLTFDAASSLPGVFGRLTPPFQNGLSAIRCGFRNCARFIRSEFQFNYGLNVLLERFYDSIRTAAPPPLAYDHILQVSSIVSEIVTQLRGTNASVSHWCGGISGNGSRSASLAAEPGPVALPVPQPKAAAVGGNQQRGSAA